MGKRTKGSEGSKSVGISKHLTSCWLCPESNPIFQKVMVRGSESKRLVVRPNSREPFIERVGIHPLMRPVLIL